jgi:hypothetical protein
MIERLRGLRTLPWRAARRVLARLVAETAAVLAVLALGAGALTWADTTRRDPCQSPVCVCSNE